MSQWSNHEMHDGTVCAPDTDTLLRLIRAWATARHGTDAVEFRIELANGGAVVMPLGAGARVFVPARRIG